MPVVQAPCPLKADSLRTHGGRLPFLYHDYHHIIEPDTKDRYKAKDGGCQVVFFRENRLIRSVLKCFSGRFFSNNFYYSRHTTNKIYPTKGCYIMKRRYLLIVCILIFSLFSKVVYSYAWPLFPPHEPQTVCLPIIMYHLITKDSRQIGRYAISPDEMEADLKYLADNNYEPVFMADLIRFVDGRKSLPEKPIVLTFDDGRNSDYDYLLPLLEKYDMKAVLSIVGQFTDENTEATYDKKPHLTWDQIHEMHKSKRVEIQSHSYHFHDGIGCGRRKSESMEEYQDRLKADLLNLQEELTKKIGRAPTTFTYPLGVVSNGSEEVLKELNFKASLSCWEGVNTITSGDPDSLFQLKRNIRRSGQPISSILNKLEKQKTKQRQSDKGGLTLSW